MDKIEQAYLNIIKEDTIDMTEAMDEAKKRFLFKMFIKLGQAIREEANSQTYYYNLDDDFSDPDKFFDEYVKNADCEEYYQFEWWYYYRDDETYYTMTYFAEEGNIQADDAGGCWDIATVDDIAKIQKNPDRWIQIQLNKVKRRYKNIF